MKRFILVLAAVMAFAGLGPVYAAQPGDVMMVGFLLFRVRYPSPTMTVEQRADAIQARVNDLLFIGGVDLSTLRIEMVGKDAAIYVADKLLVTVDEPTARANKTTPMQLARVWADRFIAAYPEAVPKL